jgi:hypothetical protein
MNRSHTLLTLISLCCSAIIAHASDKNSAIWESMYPLYKVELSWNQETQIYTFKPKFPHLSTIGNKVLQEGICVRIGDGDRYFMKKLEEPSVTVYVAGKVDEKDPNQLLFANIVLCDKATKKAMLVGTTFEDEKNPYSSQQTKLLKKIKYAFTKQGYTLFNHYCTRRQNDCAFGRAGLRNFSHGATELFCAQKLEQLFAGDPRPFCSNRACGNKQPCENHPTTSTIGCDSLQNK